MTATMSAPAKRGGLGLERVVVDVAGRDDDVLERRSAAADARLERLALVARAVDARERGRGVRRERGARRARRRGRPRRGRARARRRGARRPPARSLAPASSARPRKNADAAAEEARLVVAIDGEVHERRALVVDAVDAVRAQDRALDADGRVRVDVALHVVGDVRRERAARARLCRRPSAREPCRAL